jgi:hypothetical protein
MLGIAASSVVGFDAPFPWIETVHLGKGGIESSILRRRFRLPLHPH